MDGETWKSPKNCIYSFWKAQITTRLTNGKAVSQSGISKITKECPSTHLFILLTLLTLSLCEALKKNSCSLPIYRSTTRGKTLLLEMLFVYTRLFWAKESSSTVITPIFWRDIGHWLAYDLKNSIYFNKNTILVYY